MSGEDNTPDDDDHGQPADHSQGGPAGQPQGDPTGQAQPAGQAPAPGQPVRQGPTLTDQLQAPESMRWLKFNVAVFLAFGVGYAISFFLFSALLPGQGGAAGLGFGVSIIAFFVGLLLSPLLGALMGIRIGTEFQEEQNVVLANSFIGSAVGFLVMALVLFVLVMAQAPTEAGGGLGEIFAPLIGLAIGVGLTSTFTSYVTRWA